MRNITTLGTLLKLSVKIVIFQTFRTSVFDTALKTTFRARFTSLRLRGISSDVISLLAKSTGSTADTFQTIHRANFANRTIFVKSNIAKITSGCVATGATMRGTVHAEMTTLIEEIFL